MSGRGGYQKPRNPAPVSGPGALSRRTDGGPAQALRDLPDAKYGENAEFRSVESGAPMAQAPSPHASGGAPTSPPEAPFSHPMGEPPAPLSGGTINPDEPVTTGIPLGPGATSVPMPSGPSQVQTARSILQAAAANGGSAAAALLARLENGSF
jgi:hypothetical protein